jgi:GT2 family glycosyltransferase
MGHTSFYVAEAIVEHVGSATTHRNSDFAVYHGNRNLVWTWFKNMPGILFWVYLPQHLLANIAALCWFSMRGQISVIFRAKWSALKGLPEILKKRQQIQENKQASFRSLRKVFAKGLLKLYFRGE